jgi:hypothetical protein
MNALKNLFNWTCWMLVAPAFTFILSLVFDFSYLECVQSAPYVVCYFFYALIMTVAYVASLDEEHKPMSFI